MLFLVLVVVLVLDLTARSAWIPMRSDLRAKVLQPPDLLYYTLGLDLPPAEFL